MFFKIGQTGSDDKTPEGMGDEADFTKTEIRAILCDIVVDFLGKTDTHLSNVAFSVLLIGAGAKEHGFGEEDCNIVLQQAHVIGVALEAVHHDEEMDTSIVILAQAVLDRVISLAGSDIIERLHVALFEKHGLQVLKCFKHLLARLIGEPTLFKLLEKGSTGWATCQTCVAAKLDDSECVKHSRC